jgi:hypothetical protein
MKTYLHQLSSLLIFICLILFVSEGCKETNNDNNPASYRLTGLLIYDDGVLTDSIIYKYEGDKLLEGEDYSNYFQIPVPIFYSYPDENSIVVSSLNNTYTTEYFYLDGKMTRMLYTNFIDSVWVPQFDYTYQYQDGNLVEEIMYIGSPEGLKPDTKITYTYEGGKIFRSKRYIYNSGWQESSEEQAMYTGNLITRITMFQYSGVTYVQFSQTDFQYEGSLLTGYTVYYSPEHEMHYSYVFTYDDNGNMVIQESPERGERIEYVYEDGKGNFQQLQQPGGGIEGYVPLPWPTK